MEVETLKTEIAVMQNEIKNISTQVEKGFDENAMQHHELLETLQNALDRKAGKWVEKVIIFIGATTGTALLGALLSLIL